MTQIEKLQRDGIRRLGSAKSGFRYRHANGRPVGKAEVERIKRLVIPPAWTEVAVAASEKAKLQALGRDARGRWQYRYHPGFRQRREQQKYGRLLEFAEMLPRMRKQVAIDLRKPGLPREKVLACVIRVLACCFIRPGSQAYAKENRSYGLATLRNQHIEVKGDVVTFDFIGKSKKRQVRQLRDRRVASIIRALMKVPGKEVFKYVNGGGEVVDVRRRHINEYIKEVMGPQFSAKDFRTWAGTLICACALAQAGVKRSEHPRVRKKKVVQAVKQTAEHLGNTPTVCKSSYIYPWVLSSFDRGKVIDRYFHTVEDLAKHDGAGLHQSEKALVTLLKGDKLLSAALS
jgi:DNA topoisomerase-1